MSLIEIKLKFEKETKGTFVFSNDEPDAMITSLYVRKGHSMTTPPKEIKLVVEEV